MLHVRSLQPLIPVILTAILVFAGPAGAQESLTDTATAMILVFNDFTGSGFSPTPAAGRLDSDTWSIAGMSEGNLPFGGTKTAGDFARGLSIGDIDEGGIYAFDVDGQGDRTLGVQPTGDDMTPGTMTLRIVNHVGFLIGEVAVSYDIYWNNDHPRANAFNFSYSRLETGPFLAVSALDFTSPEAADIQGFQTTPRSTLLTNLGFDYGESLYLRWELDDVSGSNHRDEFALDNVIVMSMTFFADGFESGDLTQWSAAAATE
ncbi:MAG: hypothetical protein GY856_39280 [bacterium]|nr:hypothetical protein [bacterium]